MDFKRLPNIIALKILQYLPLSNQVRIARVSHRFQEFSAMVISTTTKLELCHFVFKDANLEKLIRLCAGSLKEISINSYYMHKIPETIWKRRIELISQLPHTQLTDLEFRQSGIEAEMVRQLLINCPNIRRLTVFGEEFPSSNTGNAPAVTCETLESLVVCQCSDDVFNFCIDVCPRLKSLRLSNRRWTGDSSELVRSLNHIIGKYSDLEDLILDTSDMIRIGHVTNLLHLSSLRSLNLGFNLVVDQQAATEISNRLGQLEDLTICINDSFGITWRDIAPLSRIKNLRKLHVRLFDDLDDPLYLDQAIYHLSGHQRLECIELACYVTRLVSSATVIALVLNCPKLTRLVNLGLDGIDSKTKAKQFVKRLRGFVQENLTIEFFIKEDEIWKSNTVQSALSRINAASNGRSISIKVYEEYFKAMR